METNASGSSRTEVSAAITLDVDSNHRREKAVNLPAPDLPSTSGGHRTEQWSTVIQTPAFIFDERPMLRTATLLDQLRRKTGIRVLYAVKALASPFVLRHLLPHIDGFTVASLFDARLAREVAGDKGFVSISTPGFTEQHIDEIGELCSHVLLNSLGQWERFSSRLKCRTKLGLRINPNVSHLRDKRYDPSRPYSKLGVEIDYLAAAIQRQPALLNDLDGISFHTNCLAEQFNPIAQTVALLVEKVPNIMERIKWINLGGGYLVTDQSDFSPLEFAADVLTNRFHLTVLIEPGAAFVRSSGYLAGSVVDIIPTAGPTVCVLDTSVNHAPEVFEYQDAPDVLGSTQNGPHHYILAGNTCLAGDIFGEYQFHNPLAIGDRIVFPDMGAYTAVKSHTFNGHTLPSYYYVSADGKITFHRSYSYDEYRSRLD